MKIPGSLKELAKQIAENDWGTPQELRFDSESNLVGLVLRPPVPAAQETTKTSLIPRKIGVSPLSIVGRPPEPS